MFVYADLSVCMLIFILYGVLTTLVDVCMDIDIFIFQSNKFSRFVQFGADQDCFCGASGCRQKLGVKPSKPKICSDAALKLVACQVAVSSPQLKAISPGKDVRMGGCLTYSCMCMQTHTLNALTFTYA